MSVQPTRSNQDTTTAGRFTSHVVDFEQHLRDLDAAASGPVAWSWRRTPDVASTTDNGKAATESGPAATARPRHPEPLPTPPCKLGSLLYNELIKRNVFRAAAGYVVAAWAIAQVADVLCDGLGAPDWSMKAVLSSLAIGFPVVLIISWHVEFSARWQWESTIRPIRALHHPKGRTVDFTIIMVLIMVIGVMSVTRPGSMCLIDTGASPQEVAGTSDPSGAKPGHDARVMQKPGTF